MRKCSAFAAACLVWLFAFNAEASTEWLLAQQQSDGSIATLADVANSEQSTAEAIRTLRILNGAANVGPALAFLTAQPYRGTEQLSRKIVASSEASLGVDALIAELITHQNADGGFGESAGFQSSVLDTGFALEALAVSGSSHAAVGPAVAHLLQVQRSDGSWSDHDTSSNAYATALIARALHLFRDRFTAVAAAVANANNYLLSRRAADALWAEDMLSAQALLTLATTATDVAPLQSSEALGARRLENASWANDVYVTALALRALYVFEARRGGASVPSTGGSVTGFVLRSGSSEAIAGATVAVGSGAQAQTNGEGYFVLAGAAAGDQTLTVRKAGYSSATRVVTVRNGQFSSAGTVYLAQSATESLVRGRVFDAHDGRPLAGVAVSLAGSMSASAMTDAAGEFEIGGLAAGTYDVTFNLAGYYAVTGSLSAPAGSVTATAQGLTRQGAFLDESPVNVSGRVVDGVSRQPLAGAQLALDDTSAGTSGVDGTFDLAAVTRGSHRLEISASGYGTATYSFLLPPGAAGALGDLALFAATPDGAATTLTLAGLVVNGLDNRPLPGASITLEHTGASVTADGQGRFALANLDSLAFDLTISASGHETRTFGVAASGFGEVAGTFALPPLGGEPGATTSTLRGVVRDSVSGAPLADASLRVAGSTASTISAIDGSFELADITAHEFTLVAARTGYSARDHQMQIGQHGVYAVDVTLTREPGAVTDLFDIVSIVPIQTGSGANTQQRFAARISNLTDEERSVLVVADVLDATNTLVASTVPFAVDTESPTTLFTFAPTQSLEVTIPWNTSQFPPGSYRVHLRLVEPGTVTRDVPTGVVLAQAETVATVSATRTIGGGLALDPPLAQAGSSQPVRLSALIMNHGNVPLTGETFTLSILDPDNGAILHSAHGAVSMLEVGNHASLDFGSWVPGPAGELPVTVVADDAATTGIINGVLYVGDKATGTFSVDRTIVPLGTQTVRARIDLQGVDVRTGTSTDPLFLAVREAVRRGGLYVGQQAPQWNEQSRCLGCHIQTQSLMGLAASVGKADIDAGALQYLYNDIVGSQQANGAFYASHPQHASVSNALALWSMSAWADARQAFRAMYRSASFQLSRLSTSGNQSWWASDHCGSWWCNTEGPTMAATQGLAGTLRMAAGLGDERVSDYTFEGAYELGSPKLMDFEQAADGTLWYLDYAGVLYARDLTTGQRRTVASGITNAYGLAIRSDGTAYVTSGSRIVQVNPDGTRSTLIDVGANSNLLDIVIGPDGFLYAADFRNHRILKVSLAGAVTVFASGGLMNQPVGLTFDSQGNLYVANFGRFTILRISSDGAVSLFARGLPYRPVWLRQGPDGAFYANSQNFNNSGYTPSGIWRIDSDGFVERLPTFDSPNLFGYNGMNFIGDVLYVGHEASQRLYRMVTQPLATPQLGAMRDAMARVARFTIARHNDNGRWNDRHAMRLITLAEARGHITDTTLLAQIDTAIANIAALLRQRQRADGGWSYMTSWNVSDPYTTAFIGLALEYTNPSVNDPAIRNSITFLLNQQRTDFSWPNQNSVFSTRLGPTSFVMAYLPIALERLGGIDTDLTVGVAPNVQLSNPSLAPSSQTPIAGGGTQYLWSLQGVTANARTVSFDVTLEGLGYQEERPVASAAYLEFKNSFTDETLRSDLSIPRVRAVSDLALTLSTGQSTYGAQSDVAITGVITNVGPPVSSGELRLFIRAADGTVVADVGAMAVGAVATGASLPVPASWNTGALLAGGYQVYGQLYNSAAVLVSEAVTAFQIHHEGAVTAATVTADRQSYQAWDTVSITGRVRNVSANVIRPDALAELQARNPAGQIIFTRTFAVGELGPGALRDVTAPLNLVDAASGEYTVELAAKDAFSRAVLATASTRFTVDRDERQALSGRIAVQSTRVARGDVNVCTDTADNLSNTALPAVQITQTVVSLDTGTVVATTRQAFDFSPRQQHVLMRSVATGPLSEGGYACMLSATYQGRTRQLAAVGFEVTVPPIRIDSDLSVGSRGRLLVLVDRPNSATEAHDPYGPTEGPDLNVQRAHLEAVLSDAGWSYTIVESDVDFEREFDTGGYEVYAILSEAVKLPVALQNRVVDAVHAGAGLLIAGNHDRRNSKLETALGVKSLSKNLDVTALLVEQSEVMDAAEAPITIDAQALEMRLEGASAIARYRMLNPKPNQETAAVATYQYGEGKSAYVGFDLPLQGAATGDDSLFAVLFINALAYLHPEEITPQVNRGLPLRLTLTNQGVATPGRVVLTLPADVTVIDGGTAVAQPDGTLAWQYTLEADAALELSLWVRLPAEAGDINFRALIQTGVAPDYDDYGEQILTVRVAPAP